MNQVTTGLGFPMARQMSTPFSLGARMRFLGALIQKGEAGGTQTGGVGEQKASSHKRKADHSFFQTA